MAHNWKHASREFLGFKNLISKEKYGKSAKWKSVKHCQKLKLVEKIKKYNIWQILNLWYYHCNVIMKIMVLKYKLR